jgi:hypothetical protein
MASSGETGIGFTLQTPHKSQLRMMQMTDMSTGKMLGMGLLSVLVIIFLILGIAAFIKYLRS